MAFSTQRATSDGTLVYLAISIDYIDRTDIAVLLNDVLADPADWEWDGTNNAIRFLTGGVPTPLASGTEVLITRSTDLAEVLHVFSAQLGGGGSAKFTNLTMDENFKQLLLIAQEAKEGSSLSDMYTDLDMHGHKLVNSADGDVNKPGDLVTIGQVFTLSGTAGTYAGQAQSSASAAAGSANIAWVLAAYAETVQSKAQEWATKAEDSPVEPGLYSAFHWAQKAAESSPQNCLLKASNLADLTNTSTARVNLGLGNVSNTSDAHKPISVATQGALNAKVDKANNLSDLTNTATARNNLGLGSASTRNVGTGSGNLMEVGAFGLGNNANPNDNSLATRFSYYSTNNKPIGYPSGWYEYGVMGSIRHEFTGDVSEFIITHTGETTFAFRPSRAEAWRTVYHSGNLPTTASRWPTWGEVTGKPDTFIPPSAPGAVGTYAFAYLNGSGAMFFGDTTVGSNLTPSSAAGTNFSGWSKLSGIWRCLGNIASGSSNNARTTLWLRIS